MKRVIIAPILLVVICILCIICLNTAEKQTDNVIGILENIKTHAENGDMDSLKKEADNAYNAWDKAENTFAFFIQHAEYEAVTSSIAAIRAYSDYEEIPELISECNMAIALLEHLNESQKIKWKNII